MGSKTAILAIRIISDATKAAKGFQQTESSMEKFERRAGKASIAAGGVVAGLVGAGAVARREASELEQAAGAVESVFGKQASAVERLAKKAAGSLGLARSDYDQLAAVMGAQLKNLGTASGDLVPTTDKLLKLGGDLAATFGGPTSDAVAALSSLLRGERDPIEKYGVSMNEAAIQAEALAMGIAKPTKNLAEIKVAQNKAILAQRDYNAALKEHGKGSDEYLSAEAKLAASNSRLQKVMEGAPAKLTAQQKAEATLSLLHKQTADASGQRAREAGSDAQAAEVAAAKTKNAWAAAGKAILPVSTAMAVAIAKAAGAAEKHSTVAVVLAAVIGTVAVSVLAVNGALKVYKATQVAVRGATVAWSVAQKALNVSLFANPIGLIVLAVVALVAGFILAYKKSDKFRAAVDAAGAAGKKAIGWVVDKTAALGQKIKDVIDWIKQIRWPKPPAWLAKIGKGVGGLFDGGKGGPGGPPRPPGPHDAPGGRGGPGDSTIYSPPRGGGGPTIIIQGAVDPVATARQVREILHRDDVRFARP